MKPKKKKSNKLLITFLTLILCLVTITGVFLGTYYYMMNQSLGTVEKAIQAYVNDINKVNKSVGTLVKGQTIDADLAKKNLPGYIDSLTAIKDKAQKFVSTEKYKDTYANLVDGLTDNINLYRQILAILQNPNSSELQSAYNDLNKYKDQCLNHYAQFNIKDIKIDLPKEALNFVNYSSTYTLELAKIRRDADIKNSQALDFSEKLDAITQRFIPLRTDYAAQLQKIRSGSGSFDDLLAQIDQDRDKYTALKKDLLSMTIPDDKARTVHTAFKNIINDYDPYIQQLKYSVNNEKAKTTPGTALSSADITAIYADAEASLSKISDKYESYLKTFSDYKSNNIK